jgi:exopolysaccharide production protein ExoQ
MAVHTKHPVAARPGPPVREKTGHLLLRAWCIFVLASMLAGVGWVNVLGDAGAGVLMISAGVLSVIAWVVIRPPFQWRRLPWFAVAYVAWAALSLTWSAWLGTSVLTWLLLALTSLQGLFVAAMLTWREIVRAVASALKWVLGLSLLFELAVSLFVQGPLLPGFVLPDPSVDYDPIVYWSRDNLFDGGRLQGLMGNANLLGPVALLGIIVFAIRFAARAPRRVLLIGWIALAAFLYVRAASATAFLAGVLALIVLITVLLMRRTRRPGERTRWYIAYAVIAIGGGLALWFFRDALFRAVGRESDLTGRQGIWQAVLERANERPVVGWGFATPWLPSEPLFDRWIVDHGETVMQAHNMWLDVYLQLGIIGVVIFAAALLAFIWRAWFFAVDRPRWDLRADRPYSPLTLLPTLVGAILLVQGVAESTPLLMWGWMFLVMFGGKIKQTPHVGVGPTERSLAIERGELMLDTVRTENPRPRSRAMPLAEGAPAEGVAAGDSAPGGSPGGGTARSSTSPGNGLADRTRADSTAKPTP